MTTFNPQLFREVKDYILTEGEVDPKKPFRKAAYSIFNFPPSPKNKYDQVYSGIVLGDYCTARNKEELKAMGITHVVNMCMGSTYSMHDTNRAFFSDVNITFIGFPAKGIITYDIAQHFEQAADFMDKALAENGKIYIHCQQGMSRSATVVLTFLMMKRGMSLMEAVKSVRAKREVSPNDGFLKQLCELHQKLTEKQ